MQNWRTTLIGLLKIAAACFFAYVKLSHGQELSTEDMGILAALGLGGATAVTSADAKNVQQQAQQPK